MKSDQYEIKFKPSHTKREISQCINYQHYSHTRSFASVRQDALNALEEYPISNCTYKEKSKNFKCVLYKGNHLDNYKGYMIYKKDFSCITGKTDNIQTKTTNCKDTN